MEQPVENISRTKKMATAALISGIVSLLILAASVPLGIIIKEVGIVSFFNIIPIPAIAAVVLGIFARKQPEYRKMALSGLVMGCIAFMLMFFARLAIFLFFIPWLGA